MDQRIYSGCKTGYLRFVYFSFDQRLKKVFFIYQKRYLDNLYSIVF